MRESQYDRDLNNAMEAHFFPPDDRGVLVCQTSDGCAREVRETDTGICPECRDHTGYEYACQTCDFVSETKRDACPNCLPEGL